MQLLLLTKKSLLTSLLVFFITSTNSQNIKAQNLSSRRHKGVSTSGVRVIEFAGCEWFVKSGYGGPGSNYWSDSEQSVWVDDKRRLHLKIRKMNGKWYCPEVYTQQYTGYGEHRFLIEYRVDQMDKNVVLGLFTYADDEHEIDIEFSKWGYPNYKNIGSYTIQPYTVSGNIERFEVDFDSIRTTNFFNWQQDYVMFGSIQGHHEGLYPAPDYFIHRWIYWGDYIPKSTDNLRTHINFWLFQGKSPIDTSNLEVVITKVIQPISVNINKDEQKNKMPDEFELNQNYPNPFTEKQPYGIG